MVSELDVLQWADERGILEEATIDKQFIKMVEEVGEIAECLAKGKPLSELEKEIGDVEVTRIILCKLVGTTAGKCLDVAFNKISGRTGRMKDGAYIKDGD